MALQLSGISVAMGFALKGATSLDVREILDTLSDRDALVTSGICPEGLRVYVKETKKLYLYNGASWTVVGAGDLMQGATSEKDGVAGLVPAPKKENVNMFLRGDGTWAMPTIEGGGIGSLEDLGITATAEELNYMSGVTSSVQTQINSLSTDKVDVDRTWGGETTALPSFE